VLLGRPYLLVVSGVLQIALPGELLMGPVLGPLLNNRYMELALRESPISKGYWTWEDLMAPAHEGQLGVCEALYILINGTFLIDSILKHG